jgi:hypothetical protein
MSKRQVMMLISITANVSQIGDSWLFSRQFCQCAVMFSLILKKK